MRETTKDVSVNENVWEIDRVDSSKMSLILFLLILYIYIHIIGPWKKYDIHGVLSAAQRVYDSKHSFMFNKKEAKPAISI